MRNGTALASISKRLRELVKSAKYSRDDIGDSFDAENGRFDAADFQVIPENGINDYHGSLIFKAEWPALDSFLAWIGTVGSPTMRRGMPRTALAVPGLVVRSGSRSSQDRPARSMNGGSEFELCAI